MPCTYHGDIGESMFLNVHANQTYKHC
uniref:Uncharacterized protein n=1 Tax=Anguilla anguilla TaxID=7936 RepID=A0A0E9VPJ2_ANGAN